MKCETEVMPHALYVVRKWLQQKNYHVDTYSMYIVYDPGWRDNRLVLHAGLQLLLQKLERQHLEQSGVYSLNSNVLEQKVGGGI